MGFVPQPNLQLRLRNRVSLIGLCILTEILLETRFLGRQRSRLRLRNRVSVRVSAS
ncbi:hypothetical protein [Planktothricoides raciborskii]|uniref:Uncharacterized protein n=1 Tax=Planktothricoides raciborskii FACHB-1370 TaxID=2949576 RepID=A0ABR8ED06_9CYAN|nr:hypothetical protein [Planktothricoides raciborskii]MBD2543600.1 hypothetical protein [Planktothricoides raciborskii FACHB-1370]MBD2581290.1 hypothetical protein [Planktothricoides raciborskii FACHB-1261]